MSPGVGRLWRNTALAILTLWVVAVTSAAENSADDESNRIDAFHALLLDVMQSGAGFTEREAALASVVRELFDLSTISRISLGRTWKTLNEELQLKFSSLLEELVIATYADRFDSYSGQSFHTLAAEPMPRGWVVKTELERSNGERVTMDYYFRDGRVFNVVANGVSDLSLRRADYNSVVKSEGYERLVSRLRENVAELRGGGADG